MKREPATATVLRDFLQRSEIVLAEAAAVRMHAMTFIPLEHQAKIREMRRESEH